MAGTALTCPACGRAIQVPGERAALRKPIVVAPPPPNSPRTVWSERVAATAAAVEPPVSGVVLAEDVTPVEQNEMVGVATAASEPDPAVAESESPAAPEAAAEAIVPVAPVSAKGVKRIIMSRPISTRRRIQKA